MLNDDILLAIYILILVLVTVAFIQGHKDARKETKLYTNCFIKFQVDLDGIWCAVKTCWSDELHTHFFNQSLFKGKNSTYVILSTKKCNVGLYSDICRLISFKLGMMTKITIKFDTSLHDIDIHSRSRLCEKSVTHFLTNSSDDLDDIYCAVTASWFVEVHARFLWQDQYLREKALFSWFYEIYLKHFSASRHLWTYMF